MDQHEKWVVATTIYVTVAVLAIYFAVSFVVKSIFNFEMTDATAIFLALIPFVVYLIVSGKIKEFRGGGFEIKFKEASEKEVQFEQHPIEYEVSDIIFKDKLSALPDIIRRFIEKRSTILGLRSKTPYDAAVLKKYLEELTKFEYFKYVVFFDRKGKFQGFVPARTLLINLENERIAHDIVNKIEENEPDYIPGFREKFIQRSLSNRETLKILDDTNLTHIAVVDMDGAFLGFASRDTITLGVVRSLLLGKKLDT